jgi:type I restriction enzyme S subunit
MRKYDKYKSSGIDWIGEIPKDWNIKRLKEIANVETGNTPSTSNPNFYSEEGMPWIKPDNLNDFIELTDSAEKLSENGIQEARVVRKGAVLVCCIGTIGKIGIAGCDLATNQQINSVEFYNKRILDNYGKYLLYISEAELVKQSNKVVVSILNKIKQSQIKFPIPSIEEQLSIANYLDYQTQKIDCLIANKKAQAEKLKELRQIEINNAVTKGLNPNAEMKDSGIDWLGKIPKHWGVKRVKSICKIVNGSTPSSSIESYWDGHIIWVTPGDFKNFEHTIGDSDSKISDEGYKNCGTSLVPIGSIILTTRAPIGNVLIASKELCTNQGCKSLIPFRINSEFLYYYVSVSSIQLNVLGQGTTFLELSTGNLSTFKVPLPPKKEQEEIAKHLQIRTTAIDKLVNNIDVQIEKLQELRKIKIYEAVTGKIKVNAYVEATA